MVPRIPKLPPEMVSSCPQSHYQTTSERVRWLQMTRGDLAFKYFRCRIHFEKSIPFLVHIRCHNSGEDSNCEWHLVVPNGSWQHSAVLGNGLNELGWLCRMGLVTRTS